MFNWQMFNWPQKAEAYPSNSESWKLIRFLTQNPQKPKDTVASGTTVKCE